MTEPNKYALTRINKGNPSICTLKVTETSRFEERKLRRLNVNLDDDVSKFGTSYRVIMIVGETGSGKTLMLNALLNYVLGVQWQDTYRYRLDPDELENKKRSQTMSQTEWISAYTMSHHSTFRIPCSLTIIDTPGFGDVAGIERDKQTIAQMKYFFGNNTEEGIDQMDAVIFVAQSDKPRLTPSQRFVFDCVLSLFGKDIKDNIFLFTTFADQNEPLVIAGMKKAEIPYKAYYKFNNSPLYAQKESKRDDDSDDEREIYNKMFWKSGEKQFNKFFTELGSTSSKSTRLSFQVLRERDALGVRIKAIPQLIRSNLVTLERLKNEEALLRDSQDEVKRHSDYEYTVNEEVTSKKELPNGEYSMTCKNCEVNCHHPCNPFFKNMCVAFSIFGGCNICPGKCAKRDHDNEDFIYVRKIQSKKQTYTDIKAKYDDALKTNMSAQELVDKVSTEANDIRNAIKQYVREVREIFERLDQIALKKTTSSTSDYLLYLIDSEKSTAELGWHDRVIQLETMLEEARLQERLASGGEVSYGYS